MKNRLHILLAGTLSLFVAVSIFAPDRDLQGQETKELSEQQLQELYMTYLKSEGYQPSIDGDGDVKFKVEGKSYYIIVSEKDLQFFQIMYPAFWKVEDLAERQKVLLAAHHATSSTKCAKVIMVKDHAWATVEIFVESPEDFKKVFARSMSALRAGVDNFVEKMRE